MTDASAQTTSPDVLVIGAGPTGLMLACQLARQGVNFRIIDKKSGPTDKSKAIIVHAKTMELFQNMGLADEAMRQGQVSKGLKVVSNGVEKASVNLVLTGSHLTKYSFLLNLEQSVTERLLLTYLEPYKIGVEWNTEALSIKQNKNQVKVMLQSDGKHAEKIVAKYVCGADGAHSVTRHQLDMDFVGSSYDQTFLLADIAVESHLDHDSFTMAVSKGGIAAFFPMPGGERFRLITMKPRQLQKEEITIEDIQHTVDMEAGFPVRVSNMKWSSLYKVHHRVVRKFKVGRCFLLGDAAHIHSPIGGQGMNTGLQDAANLGWKLGMVIRGEAKEAILDTYSSERLPFAKALVNTTDRMFVLVIGKNMLFRLIRNRIVPLIVRFISSRQFLRYRLFKLVSQTGIKYPKSQLNGEYNPRKLFNKKSSRPGIRAPWTHIMDEKDNVIDLFDIIRGRELQLLYFSDRQGSFSHRNIVEELNLYAAYLKVHFISQTTTETAQVAYKATEECLEKYGIHKECFYLIRPDGYIAYRSQPASLELLKSYLSKHFIPSA